MDERTALIHKFGGEIDAVLCRHQSNAALPPLILGVEGLDRLLAVLYVGIDLQLAHRLRDAPLAILKYGQRVAPAERLASRRSSTDTFISIAR